MVRILVADRVPVYRHGLRGLLSGVSQFELIGETDNRQEALQLSGELQPDVVILDARLAGSDSTEIADEIIQVANKCSVIVTGETEQADGVIAVFGKGGRGYVLKHAPLDEFITAIRAVSTGTDYLSSEVANKIEADFAAAKTKQENSLALLTNREREVLSLVGTGITNRKVGDIMAISEKTVKHHLTSIYRKLGVNNRIQAVLIAKEQDT